MTPYLGEVRFWPVSWAPYGWEFCRGQLLAIADNETLYNLIGTTFGGDGQDTFGLPDLRGRTPIGVGLTQWGTNYDLAEAGGAEQVQLSIGQLPSHGVPINSAPRTLSRPTSQSSLATGGAYAPVGTTPVAYIAGTGDSQPHENMPEFLVINWIISLYGIFPQQN